MAHYLHGAAPGKGVPRYLPTYTEQTTHPPTYVLRTIVRHWAAFISISIGIGEALCSPSSTHSAPTSPTPHAALRSPPSPVPLLAVCAPAVAAQLEPVLPKWSWGSQGPSAPGFPQQVDNFWGARLSFWFQASSWGWLATTQLRQARPGQARPGQARHHLSNRTRSYCVAPTVVVVVGCGDCRCRMETQEPYASGLWAN